MPSIALVQQAVATLTGAGNASVAMGANVLSGSLLVGVYTSFDNPTANMIGVAFTDTAGNTWQPYGASYQDPSVSGSWMRLYYCASAIAGATTVTATPTGGTNVQSVIGVAEFSRPSTLIAFDSEGVNVNEPSPGVVKSPTLMLPGPGLMVAAMESNRTDMVLDAGTFVALTGIAATGCNMQWSYAINPNGPVRASWTRTAAGTVRGAAEIMSFIDTAGFGVRPPPLSGRGASW